MAARGRVGVLPLMLHPVHGLPVFLSACTMQQSRYGCPLLAMGAFMATHSGRPRAEARALRERVLPRVVAASPSCVALHAELAQCLVRGDFFARVHVSRACVVYIVRVPWMPMPTSLPRGCAFVPHALCSDALVSGCGGVCLELRVSGGSTTTYRALRFLPEGMHYVQAVTLPAALRGGVSGSSGGRTAFLPHGTHFVLEPSMRDAVRCVARALAAACGAPPLTPRVSME